MTQGSEGRATGTRQVELPGERQFGLPQGFRSLVYRRTARIDFLCNLTIAAAVVGAITTAPAVWRPANRNPLAPAVTSAAPVVPPPAALVQVRNPFDATEVFEFPAGTTKTVARKAVAEQLLQRARDRLGQQGVGIKHAGASHLARVTLSRDE